MGKKKRETWQEDFSRSLKMGPMLVHFDNIQLWLDRAEAFHDAAQATVHSYLKDPDGKVDPVPAIGFLYRHSIELLLKAIVILGKRSSTDQESFLLSHNLTKLWEESLQAIIQVWPNNDEGRQNDQVETWIKKLEDWDEKGFSFRYPMIEVNSKDTNRLDNTTLYDLIVTCERLYRWLARCGEGMLNILGMQNESDWNSK